MPRFVLDERVKHALIALAIALVAGFLTLLRPLDITAWALQARLFEREASGEFVYVRMPTPTEDVALTNRTVLHTVENLRAAGAGRIFINIPLRRSGSADTDERLRAFISANSNSVFLTNSVEQDYQYVLALLLMRKRQLILEETLETEDRTTLRLTGAAGEGPFDVVERDLSETVIEELQNKLFQEQTSLAG